MNEKILAENKSFWKTDKPMAILAIICFCAFLFSTFYGHKLEVQYNDLVHEYNSCNEKLQRGLRFDYQPQSRVPIIDYEQIDKIINITK